MLTVLITWAYAFITIGLLGMGMALFVEKVFKYKIQNMDSILMTGIVVATVYAQFFSLFYRVSLLANVIMLIGCLLILCLRYKDIAADFSVWNTRTSIIQKILLAVLVLLWAYFTSRGYMHYDSDLYHAQSIRWIEEYGVVPGLGNLHERFAYNSSFFALSALYSLKFVIGDSMHAMNGFFALVLSISCLPIIKSWKQKTFRVVDFGRIAAIYYLITIIDDVVAPASDYAVMCMIFFVVIKWLELLDKNIKETAPYALLCVAGVYTLTLKLTAGLILLLLIKPAYMLIKEKRIKEILIYLSGGFAVALPWMIRTVVISGWLIYPFTALDLFDVDWKMDAFYIDVDAAQIKVWGRALYQIGLIDVPITGWFANWFNTTLSGLEKMLIIGSVLAVIITIISFVIIILKKYTKYLDILLVMITMAASYVFWQTSAPLIRYGYAYVLLLTFVVFGWCFACGMDLLSSLNIRGIVVAPKMVYLLFVLYGCYKIFTMADYISGNYLQEFYVWQSDYNTYELLSYEINGVTFYYPESGDRTGYDSFPTSCVKVDLEFRGETLKEGFRRK